ncbi:hypothetical protein JL722_4633 [Aureococcus anophagefferens]|nr:hypothetical protein JL722_4633 [Aureococcus anophagefferens]
MARTLVILIVALPSLAVALRPLLRRLRSPPPRDVTVVKLGGSAITDKARFETLDEAGLRAAAEAVRRCVADGRRVVVVHGAGSFGHFQAREHGVSRGGDGDSWRLGLAVTRRRRRGPACGRHPREDRRRGGRRRGDARAVDIVRATSAADVDAALRGARPPRGTRIRPAT